MKAVLGTPALDTSRITEATVNVGAQRVEVTEVPNLLDVLRAAGVALPEGAEVALVALSDVGPDVVMVARPDDASHTVVETVFEAATVLGWASKALSPAYFASA